MTGLAAIAKQRATKTPKESDNPPVIETTVVQPGQTVTVPQSGYAVIVDLAVAGEENVRKNKKGNPFVVANVTARNNQAVTVGHDDDGNPVKFAPPLSGNLIIRL